MNIYKFGKKLAGEGLVANAPQLPVPSTSSSNDRLIARHFPQNIPPAENKKHPVRYCKLSSNKGKERSQDLPGITAM